MAQKNLSIKLSLNDKQFQSSLKKSMRSMKKFGGQMKSVGASFSRNLTLPILGFAAASVRAFDQQSKAVAQVEAGIESTGMAAGFTSEQLQKMAADLQSVTIFGDEEILKDATAQLLTFTNIADQQFQRTQVAALNLATRLDGDLKSASIQLGKALNDPVANLSALSRSGIQFSEEQKAIIKSLAQTNRLAEAQTIILDELDKQYGGAAEAAAEAGLGGFQQLQNALSDVSEEFGKIIVDNLDPLKKGIQSVTKFLSKLTDEQKKSAIEFGAILAVIGPVVLVIGSLVTTLSTLIPIAISVVSAITPIGLAITGVATAVGFFIKKINDYQKEWEEFNEVVGDREEVTDVFVPTMPQKTTKPTTPAIQRSTIPERIEPIKALSVATKDLSASFQTLKPIAEDFEESLSGFDIVANELESNFQSFGNVLQGTFAQALQSSDGFFKSFVAGSKKAISALMAQLAATLALNALLGGTSFGSMLGLSDIGGVGGIGTALQGLFMAEGGLATGATLAMVGEGPGTSLANPEVIAPLDKLKSMIGENGGGAVQVFGTISGSDILLSSDRARNNRKRTRGY